MIERAQGELDDFDRELADLPEPARRAEWRARIEAALFASARPLHALRLAPLVGAGVDVEGMIAEIATRLDEEGRPWRVAHGRDGYTLRTREAYGSVIRRVLQGDGQASAARNLSRGETLALAAIVYNQPITRSDMEARLGVKVSADVVASLLARGWISNSLRAPRAGAPRAYVTTQKFLDDFGLEDLAELPTPEDLEALKRAEENRA